MTLEYAVQEFLAAWEKYIESTESEADDTWENVYYAVEGMKEIVCPEDEEYDP